MALNYFYDYDNNSYYLSSNSCAAGAVVIPSTYNDEFYGYGIGPVTKIDSTAFAFCTSLTSLVIPSSVTSIGIYAFDGCTSLASITIPSSVTSIEYGAFSNCSSLTSITIPRGIASFGDWMFYGCTSLIRINVLGNAPTIGSSVFLSTNANLKIYRKKNFVTGWGSGLGNKPVVILSDNVVKSGGTGKLTTKKRN